LLAPKRTRKNRYRHKPRQSPVAALAVHLTGLAVWVRGVLMLVVMALGFLFGHDLLTQCDYFATRRVEVEGVERLSTGDMVQLARIAHGTNTLSVNLELARQRLLTHPWIAEAQVRRELPDGIAIHIREHHALALVELGKRFLLNERGEIFKEWQETDPAELPLIRGLAFSDLSAVNRPRSATFAAVMQLLELGRDPQAVIPNQELASILVDHEMGLTLTTQGGSRTIKLGYDEYPAKLQKLKAVIAFLESRADLAGTQRIDLVNLNRVVVNPGAQPPTGARRKEA
jgi:cell division protein FtsQ